jgi:hypothetical protein
MYLEIIRINKDILKYKNRVENVGKKQWLLWQYFGASQVLLLNRYMDHVPVRWFVWIADVSELLISLQTCYH